MVVREALVLIHGICQFLWCKHSHRSWFQVTNMVSLKVEWNWVESHSWALGSLWNPIAGPPLIYLTSPLWLDTLSSRASLFLYLGELLAVRVRGWVRVHVCHVLMYAVRFYSRKCPPVSPPTISGWVPITPLSTRGVWNWNIFAHGIEKVVIGSLLLKSGKTVWG